MPKEKLSIDEQLGKMKVSGIKFDIVSEENAKAFISNNTYYFKLRAFQKNYEKNGDGKYVDLDFAYLQDFSTIDMRFRKLILSMVLNIEHSMKIRLNTDISNNPNEDGYFIVNEFLNDKRNKHIINSLYSKVKSTYAGDLIKKYCAYKYDPNAEDTYYFECPFWVLVEILTFGDLIKFYNFYYEKHKLSNPLKEILFPIRCLRNAAAHNNCVLNSLKKSDHQYFSINKNVNSYVSKIKSITPNSRRNCMGVPVLHDFAALIMAYTNTISSQAMLQHTIEELEEFLKRFDKNIDYYRANCEIIKTFSFFQKIVDNFKNCVYNNSVVQKP